MNFTNNFHYIQGNEDDYVTNDEMEGIEDRKEVVQEISVAINNVNTSTIEFKAVVFRVYNYVYFLLF